MISLYFFMCNWIPIGTILSIALIFLIFIDFRLESFIFHTKISLETASFAFEMGPEDKTLILL